MRLLIAQRGQGWEAKQEWQLRLSSRIRWQNSEDSRVRNLLPSLQSCLCRALYNKGFRQHWSLFWWNWTEQCKWKCTHGMEISHLHPSPRAPFCENEPPHPLQSSSSSLEDQKCYANNNSFFSSPRSEQTTQTSTDLAGVTGGGGSRSHCSHLTPFCPQRHLQSSQSMVFSLVNALLRAAGWKKQIKKIHPEKAKPLLEQHLYLLIFIISVVKF